MERIESILVATDMSEASDAAITHAARLAKDADAALRVVHVTSSKDSELLGSIMPDVKDSSETYFREQAAEALQARVGKLGLSVEPTIEIRVGKPHKEIVKAIEETKASLLVLGATGQGGRRLGTVGGRCLRASPVSVLQIPAGHADRFRSIVACIDFTDNSKEVLRQARVIADYERADLHALHVYHIPDVSPFFTSDESNIDAIREYPNLVTSKYKDNIEPAAGGREVSFSLVEHVDYTKGILEHVRRRNLDLIVLGLTKRSRIGYALLGTTAEKVIRDSDGAVLVVN